MFYDVHFILDVTNWSRGIWLDGTMQIMDGEDILLSDRLAPASLSEFPDDRRSASEGLASMLAVAKIYDRILTLADEHGLHVDEDDHSTLIVSSGGKYSRTPVGDTIGVRPAKPLTHSTRFHIYTKPMGEMTFASGEVALTEDNVETLHWEVNVGVTRSENVVDKVQEMLDRLVVGASVMDALASTAGLLAPGWLRSPDRSSAAEETWGWFCARIREIPDSKIV